MRDGSLQSIPQSASQPRLPRIMEASVEPQPRGPDWMPITPKTGPYSMPIHSFAVDRLLAPVRTVLKSAKAVISKAPPPVADDARLNTHFLGDRTRAAAFSGQQHYPRPLRVALRRARCPAARLKHLAYLRLEPNFSCFGNHPSLES